MAHGIGIPSGCDALIPAHNGAYRRQIFQRIPTCAQSDPGVFQDLYLESLVRRGFWPQSQATDNWKPTCRNMPFVEKGCRCPCHGPVVLELTPSTLLEDRIVRQLKTAPSCFPEGLSGWRLWALWIQGPSLNRQHRLRGVPACCYRGRDAAGGGVDPRFSRASRG